MQIYLWYPLSVVTGGTTAKIMVAAKDSFVGKYIYKDTIARNIAAVIYRVRHSDLIPLQILLNCAVSHMLHISNNHSSLMRI